MAASTCSAVGVFQDGIEVLKCVEEWSDKRGERALEDTEIVPEFLLGVVAVGVSGVVRTGDEPLRNGQPLLDDGGQRVAQTGVLWC